MHNSSQALRGGSATAVFGGTEVNLLNAKLASDEVVFHASAAFGGVDIIVPREWQVFVSGMPFLGGIENKCTGQPPEGAPRFVVKATAAFGGVTVKN